MIRFDLFSRGFAALLTLLAAMLPAMSQEKTAPVVPQPPSKPTAAPVDYLVQVGKHPMWKSQVETMHPELKSKMVRISKENKNDFLVTVGKKTVWASAIRRDPNANQKPAKHDADCKDFLVQVGKKSEWASAVNCPMGKHTKEAKPLCCVAPVGESKSLPKCCQEATK